MSAAVLLLKLCNPYPALDSTKLARLNAMPSIRRVGKLIFVTQEGAFGIRSLESGLKFRGWEEFGGREGSKGSVPLN